MSKLDALFNNNNNNNRNNNKKKEEKKEEPSFGQHRGEIRPRAIWGAVDLDRGIEIVDACVVPSHDNNRRFYVTSMWKKKVSQETSK